MIAEEGNSVKRQYSFAGPNAKTANSQTLAEAKAMDEAGVANETIRQQTGWFKGMDGKWRFEVDDSSSRISEDVSNYMTLGELLKDAEILKAYPNMEDVSVVFQSLPKGVNASYSPQFDTIDVNYNLKSDPEAIRAAVLHEIQHVIQRWEGFTKGTTVGSWDRKIKAGFDSRRGADIRKARETEQEIRRIQKEEPEFYRDMMELNAMLPDMPRGEVDWDTLEQITEDPPEWQAFDARRDQLQETYGDMRVWDFMDLLHQQEKAAENEGRSATELYWDTAGEIEARNTAGRRNLTVEERKNTPPMLGDEDTVFAEGNGISADYVGKTRDGIEVYETSEEVKKLSWKDRKKTFLQLMRNQFRGRTAKFIRNGHTYYAKFEYRDVSKNIYGDESSDQKGYDAKINVGVDGNIFELVENAEYFLSEAERGKDQRMHRGVKYWDYFIKTVQIDGTVYDLLAHIRKKDAGNFVYTIEMYENKNIEPSSPEDSSKDGQSRMPNGSNHSIQDGNAKVKRQMSISQTVNRKNVADDLRGILSRGGDVAELRRYISQLEQGGGKAERTGRNAYKSGTSVEQSESQRIINMAKRYGISVEEYLRRNWEQYEVDGQWNEAARKALDVERLNEDTDLIKKEPPGKTGGSSYAGIALCSSCNT